MFNMKNMLAIALFAFTALNSATCRSMRLEYDNATLIVAKGFQVAAYMDKSGGVNRCEDFYSWCCNGWTYTHPATERRPTTSYLTLLNEVYIQKSAILLQQRITADNDELLIGLKNFFTSCRNDAEIRSIGLAPLHDYIHFDGGWPKISDAAWYENEYDWLKLVAFSKRQFNADVFIGFDVVSDTEQPRTYRIQLGAPKLPLGSKAAHLDARFVRKRKAYENRIADKLAEFFPTMPINWPREVAAQVLEVEQKLAKAVPEPALLKERYVAELKSSYGSYIDLSRYLNLIFNKTISEKVYESQKGYFANLIEIIKMTPKLILANYTYWKIVDQFDYGGDDYHCAARTMSYFPQQLGLAMDRAFTTPGVRNVLETLFRAIVNELLDELQRSAQLTTLKTQTKDALKQRLGTMKLTIMDANNHTHAERARHYLQATIHSLERQTAHTLHKYLGNTTEEANVPANYATHPLPIYDADTNSVLVPLQFLQPHIFWESAYPVSFKHGTFTFLLVRQIIYGLHNPPVDHNFQAMLRKHIKCLERQHFYAVREFQNKDIHDPQLLQHAIADNAALRIAHHLYGAWLNDGNSHRVDDVLPHVHATNMQQFFIAFAQIYCANHHDSVESFSALPEAVRVNGAVANMDAFAKAYKCDRQSSLTHEQKCVLY